MTNGPLFGAALLTAWDSQAREPWHRPRRRRVMEPVHSLSSSAQIVRQSLRRRLGAWIADPLDPACVYKRDARVVLLGHALRPDPEAVPDAAQLGARAEDEVEPAP